MRVFLCDDDRRDVSRLEKLIHKYGMDNNITFHIDSYSFYIYNKRENITKRKFN